MERIRFLGMDGKRDEIDAVHDEVVPTTSVRASRTSHNRYDYVINERQLWGVGFPVEVYSERDQSWYPGQVIKVFVEDSKKTVEVIYNCRTKILPVHSGLLRPLMTDLKNQLRMSFSEILKNANLMLQKHEPKYEAIELDAFISYSQQDAQDAVGLIWHLLKPYGVKAWLDVQNESQTSVSRISMSIAKCSVFLIYLTKSYFERVFTVFELETALALDKQVIVVWEGDERRGGYTGFKIYIDACPDKYKDIFHHEAIKFERRKHLQDAQIRMIAKMILHSANPNSHETYQCMRCVAL